jgi:hypothetical protein
LKIVFEDDESKTYPRNDCSLVAGDALEYYNPSHDLCRYLTGTAVEIAQRGAIPVASRSNLARYLWTRR